jgi:hypothetical protein
VPFRDFADVIGHQLNLRVVSMPSGGEADAAAGQAAWLGRAGRPGFASGGRRSAGGSQPFPAPWIFQVGMFRPDAAGSW